MNSIRNVLVLFCFPALAAAHHAGASYDRQNLIEVTGVVTYISWRNPHVRMRVDATRDDGSIETWSIESGPLNVIRRLGIDTDEIQVGDTLTVAGGPSRDGGPELFALNFLLTDGRELVLSSSATHRWQNIGQPATHRALAEDSEPLVPQDRSVFRVWSRIIGQDSESDVSMTAAAKEIQEAWDPLTNDGALRCVAPGMVESMVGPLPIELIDNIETIAIRIEAFDAQRTVSMKGEEPDASAIPKLQGYSVGHWEEGTLVVTTTRPSFPWLTDEGVPMSSDAVIEERYMVSEDGRNMNWTAKVTDPVNLTEPAIIRQYYEWISGESIERYDCQLPDIE